jgi:hypothetical protein
MPSIQEAIVEECSPMNKTPGFFKKSRGSLIYGGYTLFHFLSDKGNELCHLLLQCVYFRL